VAEEGSHEAQIYNAIPPAGSTQAEIVVFKTKAKIITNIFPFL
jgi:hypothetical protein